jgi:threonyl-tRNA synthetase
VLIEHYAGLFPAWLAPVQAVLITVSDKVSAYAQEVYEKMQAAGIRVELDDSNERLGAKIRGSEMKKIPYMAIIGQKEVEQGTLSVRSKKKGDLGSLKTDDFLGQLLKEIETKT